MLHSDERPVRKSTRLSRQEVQLFLLMMAEAGTSNESDYWRKLLYEEAKFRSPVGQQFLASHGCSIDTD